MIKLLKKAAKWYFEQSAKTYVWMPTGSMPVSISDQCH